MVDKAWVTACTHTVCCPVKIKQVLWSFGKILKVFFGIGQFLCFDLQLRRLKTIRLMSSAASGQELDSILFYHFYSIFHSIVHLKQLAAHRCSLRTCSSTFWSVPCSWCDDPVMVPSSLSAFSGLAIHLWLLALHAVVRHPFMVMAWNLLPCFETFDCWLLPWWLSFNVRRLFCLGGHIDRAHLY